MHQTGEVYGSCDPNYLKDLLSLDPLNPYWTVDSFRS